MRILLAEDQAQLAESLVKALMQAGFAVDHAADGEMADQLLKRETFALVVLDIGLPRLDGWEVLKRLRARGNKVPVLVLTAHGTTGDRVKGLDLGADDYLGKPFELAELEARVRALTRRGMAGGPTLLRHGALTYDQVGRTARINGDAIELSAREVSLLEIFLQRAGRLVSKDQLVGHLCEWGEEVSGNAIEVYVHRLRKKLEPGGVRIVTVRGLGYSLEKSPT